MTGIFDTHAHYADSAFDEDREQVLAELPEKGVKLVMLAASGLDDSAENSLLSQKYGYVYAAAGVHPESVDETTDGYLDSLREMIAANNKIKAVGEIGLDYYYGTDDREEQQELFRKQIRLANELKMPIMIHSRDAHQLTMDILKEEGAFSDERKSWFLGRPAPGTMSAEATGHGLVPDARVQMHCFSGSPELALEYVKLGATISLGGPVTFKNGKKAAEVVRQVPIEYLLSETDAPYMAPEPLRGRPNRSEYIEHIVRRMAVLKGLEYEEAARILTENGKRFFGI